MSACEWCNCDLPADADEAFICSSKCTTVCRSCADEVLGGKCPNCGGELVLRRRCDDENPNDLDGAEYAERLLGSNISDQLTKESEEIERERLYNRDWELVSWQYRESKAFICESWGVDLSTRKYLLHVHHMDQNKRN